MSKLPLPVDTGPNQKGRETMLVIPFVCHTLALLVLQEAIGAFDDVGKLLLGGVVTVVVVAVGFTVVRFHIRDKKPEASKFISISTTENDQLD